MSKTIRESLWFDLKLYFSSRQGRAALFSTNILAYVVKFAVSAITSSSMMSIIHRNILILLFCSKHHTKGICIFYSMDALVTFIPCAVTAQIVVKELLQILSPFLCATIDNDWLWKTLLYWGLGNGEVVLLSLPLQPEACFLLAWAPGCLELFGAGTVPAIFWSWYT